jgi:hypothetical protein
MNLRHAAAFVGLVLIGAILIYTLMPRYYLIVALPDKTMVQLGPFITRTACENARREVPETIIGGRDLDAKDRAALSVFFVCLATR